MLEICLMGTGGSVPKLNRWLASAIIRHNGHSIVIDTGEGTQLALKAAGFTMKHIDLILITHFHADHISGLPGMLLEIGNEGREEPVYIAGPRGVEAVVSSLCIIADNLPFELRFVEFDANGGVLPDEAISHFASSATPMSVKAFPLFHSKPCLGYRFSLKRGGKFDPERAKETGLPVNYWGKLQRGESVEYEGVTYSPETVLGPPRRGIEVSYVTDSRPGASVSEAVSGSDLLICEGMFPKEKEERALKSRHMTAGEAAKVAKDANVRELWLTHFSPSVTDTGICLEEAKAIFENTYAGFDGMKKILPFE